MNLTGWKYQCAICDLFTNNKKDYEKHLSTFKHKCRTNPQDVQKLYRCSNCDKKYKSRVGVWKHRKTCIPNAQEQPAGDKITPELIMNVLDQNKELTQLVMEQNKTIMQLAKTNITINNQQTNISNNNKTFNLHVFLNETCKDAMNIYDFVNSLNLQLSDLENMGRLGFVDGISNIIVKKLQSLDVHRRPVHCTDRKREIIYVKDRNQWEREDEDNIRLRNAIRTISDKNQQLLSRYQEVHPRCNYSESSVSDQYSKIIIEVMGGTSDTEEYRDKEHKIIQKVARNVVIHKKDGQYICPKKSSPKSPTEMHFFSC